MEIDEACLFRETGKGEIVAAEGASQFSEFLLLIAGPEDEGTRHIFEELENVFSIFGEKDVRLPALGFEEIFLVELRKGRGSLIGEADVVGGLKASEGEAPCGEVGDKIGRSKSGNAGSDFSYGLHILQHRSPRVDSF